MRLQLVEYGGRHFDTGDAGEKGCYAHLPAFTPPPSPTSSSAPPMMPRCNLELPTHIV